MSWDKNIDICDRVMCDFFVLLEITICRITFMYAWDWFYMDIENNIFGFPYTKDLVGGLHIFRNLPGRLLPLLMKNQLPEKSMVWLPMRVILKKSLEVAD